jgi:YD repeat-containing protein
MTVSGQAPVSYAYDHNARLRTITQAPLNPVAIDYDAVNRRTLLTLPNGVSTEYQYHLASRLTAIDLSERSEGRCQVRQVTMIRARGHIGGRRSLSRYRKERSRV